MSVVSLFLFILAGGSHDGDNDDDDSDYYTGEMYYLKMTARRGRNSDCCHYIQSHEGEFINAQDTESEEEELEGPGQWGD